jgi:predicted type IV restriction endonuclease
VSLGRDTSYLAVASASSPVRPHQKIGQSRAQESCRKTDWRARTTAEEQGAAMDLATRVLELQKRTIEHREVLLTEEAAKTALVMPFLQSLGYDVFNPGEVVPEFTADVGTKKGEKVDYAICNSGKVAILIECKPSSAALSINHASQLFRYFSVTDARLAVLTNGVNYQFYSDVEKPNKMDDKPFFTFSMDAIKPTDIKTLEKFAKNAFDVDKIVQEAGDLKTQSLLRKEIEREFAEPSEEFVRMMAARVHEGRVTPAVKENFARMLGATIAAVIRDLVNERLSSALNASAPPPRDCRWPGRADGRGCCNHSGGNLRLPYRSGDCLKVRRPKAHCH